MYTIPHTIRLYTIIFEKNSPPKAIPYNQSFICNLIKLILYYHFKAFTSDLYLKSDSTISTIQSDSALSFSKILHPPRQVHTINHSSEIWFNWFYFITSKHLHQNFPYYHIIFYPPYNQNLHYNFQKFPTPLGESIQSIIQMQSDSTDSILSFQ